MDKNSILKIINNSFNLNIDNQAKISDFPLQGVNSVSFIKMVIILESEFDIEFADVDLDFKKYNTIQDIIDYVEKKVIEKQ